MAKIGTAHVEIKPVINDEALAQITEAIKEAVKAGVREGMDASRPPMVGPVKMTFNQDRMASCPCRPENGGSGVCGCTLGGPTVTC